MGALLHSRAAEPVEAVPILEMIGVNKSFETADSVTDVLRGVNLDVQAGEFVAIVGHAGSGKTTLASLMAGLLHPDDGFVLVDGARMAGRGPDRELVPENDACLPWLTVRGNVLRATESMFPEMSAAERAAHAERYIEKLHLTSALGKRPEDLSRGMQRRLAVACALAKEPRILLMDEPLGTLDALTRAILQAEIEDIWASDHRTIVLITDSIDEAVLLADRIIPLAPGPGATLGPSFPVDLPRPRDRTASGHSARFERLRRDVTRYLMDVRAERTPERPVPRIRFSH